ncbi:hypothetical protein R1T43_19185 [Alteromonas sp. CI.11.F.A3]|uniref:hypothetical protein n=1 Tax=Alteromonas sp. CI.11.F.A3 TaxID=3079555 RepID=UPI0029428431|nr:hypothetical protein [Alteromonas sp. CI.11.F.A3]WOI37287.1 hypothetical protein R1T43_19185 [Alteromonas sp. CI.11.F.A3]
MPPASELQISLRNARAANDDRKIKAERKRLHREMELKEEAVQIAKANSKKVTAALVISTISLLMSAFSFIHKLL